MDSMVGFLITVDRLGVRSLSFMRDYYSLTRLELPQKVDDFVAC